jgi:hypothetical protein
VADGGRKPTTGGVLLGSDYDTARTRKMNADAEIAELELAMLRKEVAKTDDVVKAWESVLHAAKTKLLAIPTKMAPVLSPVTDTAIIKDMIEQAVREALDEMANYHPAIDPTAVAVNTTAEAPAEKPKRKPGRPRKIDQLK